MLSSLCGRWREEIALKDMPGQALPSAQGRIFLACRRSSNLGFTSEHLGDGVTLDPQNIEEVVANLRVAYFFCETKERTILTYDERLRQLDRSQSLVQIVKNWGDEVCPSGSSGVSRWNLRSDGRAVDVL
jgi:hypothetical protein